MVDSLNPITRVGVNMQQLESDTAKKIGQWFRCVIKCCIILGEVLIIDLTHVLN